MGDSFEDKFHLEGGELIRQVTFGMNDGVVSIFALLAGIAGAGQDPKTILITLLAATIAGALSMAAGEFISSKSERDYFKHEIKQERLEIKLVPEIEKEEIRQIYRKKGFEGQLLEQITEKLTSVPKQWVKEMVMDELGVSDLQEENGIKTSAIIFIAFCLGALFPVIPYALFQSTFDGQVIFWIATVITFGGLFFVGAMKKFVTGVYWLKSGLEMLIVGLFAFGISYLIGNLVGVSV